MVKIWFCYEGDTPTLGGPAYEMSLEDTVGQLDLQSAKYLSDLSKIPRFPESGAGLGQIAGYKHVVAEVGEQDVMGTKWKTGFYRLQLSPNEVIDRLGNPAAPLSS